jgi:ligand-binding sensor domain-containing protein
MSSMSFGKMGVLSILLTSFVLCGIGGCKRISDDPLAHWKAIQGEPAEDSTILQQAEESHCIWSVAQDAGTRRIAIQQTVGGEPKERRVRLQTEAGVLVGTDDGEWGGTLSLTDANGIERKRLLDKNVIQLFPWKSGVLVFTGLLHLGTDEGAVWLYSKGSDGSSSIKKIADLNGKPNAASSSNGGALAVGGHGVYRLDQSFKLTEIPLPFAQTHPNSISEDAQGRIYIGMNAFVVRLVPAKTGYKREWFTRPGCLL